MAWTLRIAVGCAALAWACGGGGAGGGTDSGVGGGADAQAPDAGVSFAHGPGARAEAAVVFDPPTGKLLVFGGDQGVVSAQAPVPDIIGETWILDTHASTWHMVTAAGPSARARVSAAYDSVHHAALVFGGRFRVKGAAGTVPYTLYNEVWSFDFAGEGWTLLPATGTKPSPRMFAAVGFDAMSGVLVVVGGNTSTSGATFAPTGDAYQLDASNVWSLLSPTGTAPTARHFGQYAFDEGRRRLVMFSGKGAGFFDPSYKDTVALDLSAATPAWVSLNGGSGAPSARFGGAMVYDKDRDRMLLFGGHEDDPPAGDIDNVTWSLNLSTGAWSQLRGGDSFTHNACIVNGAQVEPLGLDYSVPDRMSPERRFKQGLVSAGGSALLFGGESDCAKLDDVWTLDLATSDGVWQRALKATQGEGCARRNDQCPCYCN